MRRFLFLALVLLAGISAAATALTREVLVLASGATTITRTSFTFAIELQNLGPNPIYCSLNDSGVTVNSGHRVDANGGVWELDAKSELPVYCIASTADQVSGAGTRVTELR